MGAEGRVERDDRQATGRRAWLLAASAAAAVALLLVGQAVLLSDTGPDRRIVPERELNGNLALISLRGGVDLMATNGFTDPWLTRADLTRACHEPCVARDLAWSADGSTLAMILETSSKRAGLYVVSAGSRDVRFLADCPYGSCASEGWDAVRESTTALGPDGAPAVMAPDRSRIAYLSTLRVGAGLSAQLWTAGLGGTDPVLLYDFGCCFLDWSLPVWAPDGTRVAIYLHLKDGLLESTRVSVLDFPSGARLRLIDGFGPLSWQRRPRAE